MRHFDLSEFQCKCGCGKADMQSQILTMLDEARDIAGVPFTITSGFRCVTHNARVGGKSNSAHTRGYAADIRTGSSAARYKIMDALLRVGFNRVGIAKSFIHVDDDPSLPTNVMWDY